MKLTPLLTFFGIAMLAMTPANNAQAQGDGVVLKPVYKAGKTYKFQQEQKMKMIMSVPGTEGEMEQNIASLFEMTAIATKRDDAAGVKVTTTIDRIMMDMKNPAMGMDMSFDSAAEDAAANPIAAQFNGMLGKQIALFYDDKGTIEKTEGFEEFMASAGGANMFTEEQFTQMADPTAMLGLGNEPKKVGAKWKAAPEVKMGDMGSVKMPMDLEYSGTEKVDDNDCAKIDMVGTAEIVMNMPGGEGQAPAGGITSENSKVDGYYLIDPELGMLRSSLLNMSLTMKVNAGGQQMSMPMTQVSTYKLTSVEDTK